MALSKNDKWHIEQLLSGMGKTLRNKGYKLYVEGGCSFIEYQDDTNQYEFAVQGNIEPHMPYLFVWMGRTQTVGL